MPFPVPSLPPCSARFFKQQGETRAANRISIKLDISSNNKHASVNSVVAPQVMPFSFGQGTLTSGQPVTIQCNVIDGDLPMTMRWMFHGRELSSQMGVTTFRLNPHVSLLSIDAVAAAHAGDYTCTAENAAGIDSQSATLLVQGQLLTDYQTTKKNSPVPYSSSHFLLSSAPRNS